MERLMPDDAHHVMSDKHGIGAPGHETENHFLAIRRSEGEKAEKAAREAARKRLVEAEKRKTP